MSKEKLLEYVHEKLVDENNTHTKHMSFLALGSSCLLLGLGVIANTALQGSFDVSVVAPSLLAGFTGYQMLKSNNQLKEDNECFNTLKEFRKFIKNSNQPDSFYEEQLAKMKSLYVNSYEEDRVNSDKVKDHLRQVMLQAHINANPFIQDNQSNQRINVDAIQNQPSTLSTHALDAKIISQKIIQMRGAENEHQRQIKPT